MIRVLIVHDNASARSRLEELFGRADDFIAVASVASGGEAIGAAKRLRPDLVALDAGVPGLSAAEVVDEILATRPIPIVLVSDVPKSSAEVFEALRAGALEVIPRPRANDSRSAWLLETLRTLSRIKVPRRKRAKRTNEFCPAEVIVVASSTGGPAPLHLLLSELPADLSAPLVIAQHLTPGFEQGLARWLSRSARIGVQLAKSRDMLVPGVALIARPNSDAVIVSRSSLQLRPTDGHGFHPSADELFASAASVFGRSTLAVVLSGIGHGGAEGARAVVAAGGRVFSQDRDSSAVFGMPGEVARQGLSSLVAPPERLARAICDAVARSE